MTTYSECEVMESAHKGDIIFKKSLKKNTPQNESRYSRDLQPYQSQSPMRFPFILMDIFIPTSFISSMDEPFISSP